MGRRQDLRDIFVGLVALGPDHVYFQAPPSNKMKYPCILYKLDDIKNLHADNVSYKQDIRYQVTVIDRDPDGDIYKKVAALPKCAFDRFFSTEGLNHYVFNLFF